MPRIREGWREPFQCSIPGPARGVLRGMATLHRPAYDHRDAASHPTDTPVFHEVEQTLHAGWLFDPRLPAPGPAIRRPAPRRRHAKVSHRAQPAS
jgi:hypothetical protein